MKKLYKSRKNQVLCGTVGGIGEYLSVDPVVLRVVWIVASAFTGFAPGILAYIVASLVVPKKPKEE